MPRPDRCRRQHVEDLLRQLTAEYESVLHECKHLRSVVAVCHTLTPLGAAPTMPSVVTAESSHHACDAPRSTHALKDTKGTPCDVSAFRMSSFENSVSGGNKHQNTSLPCSSLVSRIGPSSVTSEAGLATLDIGLASAKPAEFVASETADPEFDRSAGDGPAVLRAPTRPNFMKVSTNRQTASLLANLKSAGGIVRLPSAVAKSSFSSRLYNDVDFEREVFDGTVAFVIILNTIYLGLAPEFIHDKKTKLVLDLAFLVCFFTERIFKLFAFGLRDYFLGQDRRWNLFETVLVLTSIVEMLLLEFGSAATTPIFRLVRLGRLAKIIRVLRLQVFKELMVMVQGIVGGVRTLGWSFILISLPLYIAALVLRETAGNEIKVVDDATENFGSLAMAFFTLFRCVVAGDCSDPSGRPIFVLLSATHGSGYALLYILLVFLMTFGLFNVIVSIYVENTVASAKHNELLCKAQRIQDEAFFQKKVRELLMLIASFKNGGAEVKVCDLLSGEITHDCFQKLCAIPRFRDILSELDIAEEDQVDLFETLDVDGGGTLDIEELVTGISKLRGDSHRADVISIGLTLRAFHMSFQAFEGRLTEAIEGQRSACSTIAASTQSERLEKLAGEQ